jgi:hypothetical protein
MSDIAEFCDNCAGPYDGWLADQHGGHWDTCPDRVHEQQPAPMPMPVTPPKPRITLRKDGALLDTGHADVLHGSWAEAIQHSARICRDYRTRLACWVNAFAARASSGSTGSDDVPPTDISGT